MEMGVEWQGQGTGRGKRGEKGRRGTWKGREGKTVREGRRERGEKKRRGEGGGKSGPLSFRTLLRP